ncbi:hypothetical protein D3C76_1505560 [compost metagenome]
MNGGSFIATIDLIQREIKDVTGLRENAFLSILSAKLIKQIAINPEQPCTGKAHIFPMTDSLPKPGQMAFKLPHATLAQLVLHDAESTLFRFAA